MIEFIQFGEHKLEKNKQPEIKEALLNCNLDESYYCWLNMIYNNSQHFFNSAYSYDTWQFLKEISMIANSPTDKLIVLGGIHQDSGHQSEFIVYQNQNQKKYTNTFVSDSYIRFNIKLEKHKRLHVLNESQIFHFLVDVPQLLWIPGNEKKGNILLYNIPTNFDDQTSKMYFPKVNSTFKIKRM
jgi:hypothetical protein